MTTVWVRGLDTYAHHGVPDEEQAVGHRYRCDLAIRLAECPALLDDDVNGTVDYAAVAQIALGVLHGLRRRTVEAVAHAIGAAVLDRFPLAESVEVSLWKPLPPAPVIADAVGVTTTVRRG